MKELLLIAIGSAPRMENQMTYFLPNLSPSMPPATVPMAKAGQEQMRWRNLTTGIMP